MNRFVITLILAAVLVAPDVNAQTYSYYGPLNDPLTLASLESLYPQRSTAQQGRPIERDPVDGAAVLASDTGSGVITHFWVASLKSEQGTLIKLWIDGALVLSTTYKDFFLGNHGALSAPLDSTGSGAYVCDVQMPYRKGFRITSSGITEYWTNISWRPLPAQLVTQSFSLDGAGNLRAAHAAASNRYLYTKDPWDDKGQMEAGKFDIAPHQEVPIFNSSRAGVVQMIRIAAGSVPLFVDGLSLRVYYDGSPKPNIDVPLQDFFCQIDGQRGMKSWLIKADSVTGLTSFFAMPFASSIRIALYNDNDQPFPLSTAVRFRPQVVDRNVIGYFHADLSRSNPTRFGVWHPLLHVKGEGRFLGITLQVPGYPQQNFLEGDPKFTIDSSPALSVRLTGTEDYINSGWYFSGGPFSDPFAGCLKSLNILYRLHLLDAFDFAQSFDGDIQHGHLNDVKEDYHTVAFYYLKQVPFHADRDTIRAGELWKVSGYGYPPHAEVRIRLGSYVAANVVADSRGLFEEVLRIPFSWQEGRYTLQVNEQPSPYTIFVSQRARIQIHSDIEPIALSTFDSVRVQCYGFLKGEEVRFRIDSAAAFQTLPITVDSTYGFSTYIKLPRLRTGMHSVFAVGTESGMIEAEDSLSITDEVNFELEDYLQAAYVSGYREYKRCGYFWYARWSKQAYAFWEPIGIDSMLTFHIDMPYTDTFAVALHVTKGREYGDFRFLIDGVPLTNTTGYYLSSYGPWPDTLRLTSPIYLMKGPHDVSFQALGLGKQSEEMNGGFDRLQLTPRNRFPYSDSSFHVSISQEPVVASAQELRPEAKSIIARFGEARLPAGIALPAPFRLFDILGRLVTQGSAAAETLKVDVPNGEYFLEIGSERYRLLKLD